MHMETCHMAHQRACYVLQKGTPSYLFLACVTYCEKAPLAKYLQGVPPEVPFFVCELKKKGTREPYLNESFRFGIVAQNEQALSIFKSGGGRSLRHFNYLIHCLANSLPTCRKMRVRRALGPGIPALFARRRGVLRHLGK